jgi:hypothetical protein
MFLSHIQTIEAKGENSSFFNVFDDYLYVKAECVLTSIESERAIIYDERRKSYEKSEKSCIHSNERFMAAELNESFEWRSVS